uniref:DC_STAMP domain-containing protein n=1 Tax=Trichuris muris TaxID=70415 RepID=A0A5S6QJ29_TRIMR
MNTYVRVRATSTVKRPWLETTVERWNAAFKAFFAPSQDVSRIYSFKGRLLTYGTMENMALRSVLLYIVLIMVLTCIFSFNMLKHPSDPFLLGIICGAIGVFIAVSMAIYRAPGCVTCIMLPVVTTGTLRAVILLLALSWTIQGPMMNMQYNLQQTTKTIACVQNIVGRQAGDLETVGTKMARAKLKPFLHMGNMFTEVANRTKAILKNIETGVMIKCNDDIMQPYHRCVEMFKDGARKCDESVWFLPFLTLFCRAIESLKFICNIGLLLQRLCSFKGKLAQKIKDALIGKLERRIDQAEQEIMAEYAFNFTMNETVDYKMLYRTNVTKLYDELQKQYDVVRFAMDKVNQVFGYLILLTCLQVPVAAMFYLNRFLKADHMDNYFLTERFRRFDRNIMRKGREAVFPLMHKERKRFIPRGSLRPTKTEILTKFLPPVVNVVLTGIVIFYWLFLDVSVFNFLYVVNSNLKKTTAFGLKDKITAVVSGTGLIAETYKNIVHDMTPNVAEPEEMVSYWTSCVHPPAPPDPTLLYVLSTMLIYAFISIIFQMYFARTRSLICELYYPERIRPRLSNLHVTILSCRGSWSQFAAKCIQQQLTGAKQDVGHQLAQRLASQTKSLGSLVRATAGRMKYCTDCNDSGPYEDFENFRHCENFDCQVPYCIECYFRTKRCLNCRQIKQSDDLEIDEEKPGLHLSPEEEKATNKAARRRMLERKFIKMYAV